ncbi:hypothetical protein GUY40_18570 [Pseudomonas sp. R5(2019)]|nr:hypothetical protein [Pseudomonas sp. R5(2019)]
MSTDNLIKMANQIAQYFASEPESEQAVLGVRQHLQSFWTPAMRSELMAWQMEQSGRSAIWPYTRQKPGTYPDFCAFIPCRYFALKRAQASKAPCSNDTHPS